VDYPVPAKGQVEGIGIGNTFPNISLSGGALLNFSTTETLDCPGKDVCTTSSPTFVQSTSFADLYNAGKPAPLGQGFRYAFIDISGAWCIHCQGEAEQLPGTVDPALNGPGYVKDWLAEGGIVFSILVQNADESGPATAKNLFSWVSQYQINYPMSVDAQQNMVTSTGIKAWPGNVIIRLSDMTVVQSMLGATSEFYSVFSKQLTVCQNDPTNPNDCWAGATCDPSTLTCVANSN
jgi:hypothetical protein